MAKSQKSGRKIDAPQETPPITAHAELRMNQRSVPLAAIGVALAFGREVHTRGATIYAIGRREVREAAACGEGLGDYEGVQVVCCDGVITTVYRNRDFSGLRVSKNHFRRRRAA